MCDGTANTPDLRDRFIVGSGKEYSIGDIGGEKKHTLTINEMPEHTHEYYEVSDKRGDATGFRDCYTGTFLSETSSAGGGESHENRPPYYALAFIMKMAE